jgi:hypothetical protein
MLSSTLLSNTLEEAAAPTGSASLIDTQTSTPAAATPSTTFKEAPTVLLLCSWHGQGLHGPQQAPACLCGWPCTGCLLQKLYKGGTNNLPGLTDSERWMIGPTGTLMSPWLASQWRGWDLVPSTCTVLV